MTPADQPATGGHLDLDALSDVLAGEATPEQAEHLRTCPTCQATLADLEAVLGPARAALADLPEPPVPADLPDRLAAAISTEHAAAEHTQADDTQAEQRSSAAARASTTVLPLAPARERRSWRPWAGGAAAAAVLVAGGVLLAQHHGSSSSSATSSGTAAAGAPRSAAVPASTTGTNYAKDGTALRAALPALLRGGATGTAAGSAPAASTASSLLSSGDLAGYGAVGTSAGLASCLQGLQDPGSDAPVLGIDYARFQGTPALVVLLPGGKAHTVDQFVVRTTCRAADSGLLFYSEVPDPR